jgi:hypothetical protein
MAKATSKGGKALETSMKVARLPLASVLLSGPHSRKSVEAMKALIEAEAN